MSHTNKRTYHSWIRVSCCVNSLDKLPTKTRKLVEQNPTEKMAFYLSSDNEKRGVLNPKDLRFTQLDIAPSFSNPDLPNVEEAIYLIRGRQLDPAVFGDLTVHRDKEGVVWCENNRRLFVLRKAGVEFVSVKSKNNDYMSRRTKEDKVRLNDPNFMPRIRGETSGVQIPPPSLTSVVEQLEQTGTSLLDFVGAVSAAVVAGYWGWKHYNDQQENDQNARDRDDRNKK